MRVVDEDLLLTHHSYHLLEILTETVDLFNIYHLLNHVTRCYRRDQARHGAPTR